MITLLFFHLSEQLTVQLLQEHAVSKQQLALTFITLKGTMVKL